MVDIVVTGGARVFQLLDMETVWNRDIIRVNFRRSSLHLENTLMAADAVRINLVQFGGETGMFPPALERKDVDARHQGMACRMTL